MAKRGSKKDKANSQNNLCFGCGADNADGMSLKFSFDKKNMRVTCRVKLEARFAGPPGYCHGGIIATLLDEVMAKLNKLHGVIAVTGHLAVDYRRPVPLGKAIRLEAREVRVTGRRRFREAEITNNRGETLARGEGIFITVEPKKIFANPNSASYPR
jgi:uncharacterized protein (TIGR00369 family)